MKDWDGKVERLSDLAYAVIEHSGEHYGQLVVYYRLRLIWCRPNPVPRNRRSFHLNWLEAEEEPS